MTDEPSRPNEGTGDRRAYTAEQAALRQLKAPFTLFGNGFWIPVVLPSRCPPALTWRGPTKVILLVAAGRFEGAELLRVPFLLRCLSTRRPGVSHRTGR
jgi:hypothetical protein